MARGDIFVFDEALKHALTRGWESADVIKCAILDNTLAPTQSDSNPKLGDYTEVGTSGTYVAGGASLGTWGNFVTQSSTITTLDSSTNPSWSQDGSNDTDAFWGLVYNDTDADDYAIAVVDLGGPVDMTNGPLTIVWASTGIARITNNS